MGNLGFGTMQRHLRIKWILNDVSIMLAIQKTVEKRSKNGAKRSENNPKLSESVRKPFENRPKPCAIVRKRFETVRNRLKSLKTLRNRPNAVEKY